MDSNGLTRFQSIATTTAAILAIAAGLGTALGLAIDALEDLEEQKIATCQFNNRQDLIGKQLNEARIFAQLLDTRMRIMRIRVDVIQGSIPLGETEDSAREHARRLADQEEDWLRQLDEIQDEIQDEIRDLQEDDEC